MELTGLRGLILTLRFLCELGLLAGLAVWGFAVGEGLTSWILGIGAPVAAALVWGAFVAPKARRPVSTPVRLTIELGLFGAAAVALWFADAPAAAIALGVLGVATSILNALTQDRARPGPTP
jgi:hypothetical protein